MVLVVLGAGSPGDEVELARPRKHHDVVDPPLRDRPIDARTGRRRDEQRREQNLGLGRKAVVGLEKNALDLARRRSLQNSINANACISYKYMESLRITQVAPCYKREQ